MPVVLEVGKHKQREEAAVVVMSPILAVVFQVLPTKVPPAGGAAATTAAAIAIFARRGAIASADGIATILVRRLCVASNKVFWYLKHPKAQLSDLEKKIVLPNIRYWETKIALFESYFCLDLNLHENRSRTKSENGSREIALAIRIL